MNSNVLGLSSPLKSSACSHVKDMQGHEGQATLQLVCPCLIVLCDLPQRGPGAAEPDPDVCTQYP